MPLPRPFSECKARASRSDQKTVWPRETICVFILYTKQKKLTTNNTCLCMTACEHIAS